MTSENLYESLDYRHLLKSEISDKLILYNIIVIILFLAKNYLLKHSKTIGEERVTFIINIFDSLTLTLFLLELLLLFIYR
jgi:hypothetical protein